MADITSTCENDTLILKIAGRLDSASAPDAEAAVTEALKTAHASVVLDAEEMEYISSAGLRVLLRLRKAEPSLRVINVSSEVYEVFDMTGFTEMIPIEKACRRLSVEGCEVIGQGANGMVYRLDPDTIIKVYRDPDSLPDIRRERELARRAFVLGIPTAIPYDVVRVGDSYGSVFELLNAKSFAKLIASEPENLDRCVGLTVELLKKIHSTEVSPEDMPDMRAVALGWAEFVSDYLPEEKAKKLVSLISEVPVVHKMMHGDYHVKNVMMQNGEVLLIDMDTLCQGHPIFELASIFNAYCGFNEIDHSIAQSFLGIPYETSVSIWEKTLRLYFPDAGEEKLAQIAEKAKLIGYTRIYRRGIRRHMGDTPEGKAALELYRAHILELLDRVDTLLF